MRFIKLRIRLSAISSFFALALGASTFGPASVAAQQQAVLGGVISDAVTGEIVDAAAVTLVGTGIETRTAADGIFEFPDAPLGFVTVHVQAPGYPAVVEEVEMTPGTVRIMQVILPSADAVLRDILVVVPATDAARRGERRNPNVLTNEELRDINLASLSAFQAIQNMRPQWLRARGIKSLSGGSIFAKVLVGEGQYREIDDLRNLDVSAIAEIRFISPADATTRFGTGYTAGVILVSMR